MTDPNTGTILYDYNAFGDLIGQKDANDFIYYYKYDGLGRLIQKWGGNDVYSYTYYNTLGNASINQLQKEEFKINGVSKHKKEYTYTALGKLSSLAETVNNQVYTTNYSYKTTNQQLVTVGYPTGITLTYDYDDFNNLKKITRNGNGVIWTKNTEAIDGKLTSESFGNGYTTTYSYDTHRQLSQINSTNVTNATTAFMANYNFELQTGNLLSRGYNNSAFEDFNYDNLDRLVNIQESISSNSKTYNYANNGNITSIENGGTHTLEYEDSRPHALTKHKFENVNQTVPASSIDLHDYVYTTFDKIAHIEQNGVATLDMEYGLDQQRISMHILEYGSPSVETYYINSANLEIKNGVEYTYLYAQGKPFAIYNGTTEELVYLHLNYQGSLMAISRDNGQILERRSYDAWGRPRDPDTWDYNLGMAFGGAGKGITMRGYTMHEHLEMFSLINMNGRLYDPVLGRMLSPDNYIQAPDNTQSYNRYSYCVNNPLKYTDPSGEVFGIDDAIIIGVAIYSAYQAGSAVNGGKSINNWDFGSGKTWGAMVLGAGTALIGGYGAAGIVAGGGAMSGTLAIVAGSYTSSVGMHIATGGQSKVSIGFGAGSYNVDDNSFDGIWNWGDNSGLENLGYFLGAFGNVSDVYSLALGGTDNALLNSRSHSKLLDKNGKRELFNPGMEFNDAITTKKLPWYKGLVAKRDLITDYIRPDKPSKFENFIERNQLIKGINLKRLAKYKNKVELKGDFMIGNLTPIGATNCSGWTSSALLSSGVFNIPIAIPGLLSLQMYARQYSYLSYNLTR
jgi:RHS repeat-associated protein